MTEPMSQEEFIETEGETCPVCRSDTIKTPKDFEYSADGTGAGGWFMRQCATCSAGWAEYYKMCGYELFNEC